MWKPRFSSEKVVWVAELVLRLIDEEVEANRLELKEGELEDIGRDDEVRQLDVELNPLLCVD